MSTIFSNTLGFSEKKPKIVVIGAGIAGLTTAYRLKNEGIDVDLYEARNRVGGRIFTTKVDERIAELGGMNIGDGGEAINLNRLINEFGLELCSSRVSLKHSYFDGQSLIPVSDILKEENIDPQTLKNKLHELALTCSNMKEILENIVDSQTPLYKTLAVRMTSYEGGALEMLSPLYIETLFHMLLGGICSVHQGNENEEPYVHLLTIAGGNSVLADKLGETLGPKLHLNMPLEKVAKDKDGVFHLTFKNGKEEEADILVLSIPCSVYEQIIFEDGIIPSHKLEAIRNVQYGTNAKIMIPFTTPPTKATGLVESEMVSYFDLKEQLLTMYCTGKTSLFSSDTIVDFYTQTRPILEKGFESACPPFMIPVYAKDQNNLTYEGPVGYSWTNDSYAKGSYSYIASGQEDLLTATENHHGEIFKTLFAPIQQSLYFVGEHASILSDVGGTMEAACESGERIAKAIVQEVYSIPKR